MDHTVIGQGKCETTVSAQGFQHRCWIYVTKWHSVSLTAFQKRYKANSLSIEGIDRSAGVTRIEVAYPTAFMAFALTSSLTIMSPAHADASLLDFSRVEVVRTFRIVNDAVMGGVSTSQLSQTVTGV